MDLESFKQAFRTLYGSEPQLFRAPGRVNLIGEHTDYNQGFVMPAAIDFYTWLGIATRADSIVNIRSDSFTDTISVRMGDGFRPRHGWSDYVVGVLDQISRSGRRLAGADISFAAKCPWDRG